MPAPPNWPINSLVYAEEAMKLAREHCGIRPDDHCGFRLQVRDAEGQEIRHVVACCEATGKVIRLAIGQSGAFLTAAADAGPVEIEEDRPAPLTILCEIVVPGTQIATPGR